LVSSDLNASVAILSPTTQNKEKLHLGEKPVGIKTTKVKDLVDTCRCLNLWWDRLKLSERTEVA
jgi:hypothetical protein